ncbi:hypothetical protein D3C78_569150 [compost metagenome]
MHVAIAGRAFRQIADQPLGLEGVLLDVEAEQPCRARGRREKAGEHLHGGRLAGAVGAEEAQHLAGLNAEGQVVHHGVLCKAFGEFFYFDHGDSITCWSLRARRPRRRLECRLNSR